MPILVEIHPGYRLVTLNRPERLNALTVEMAEALIAALADAEADKTCRAVLLTGTGRAGVFRPAQTIPTSQAPRITGRLTRSVRQGQMSRPALHLCVRDVASTLLDELAGELFRAYEVEEAGRADA